GSHQCFKPPPPGAVSSEEVVVKGKAERRQLGATGWGRVQPLDHRAEPVSEIAKPTSTDGGGPIDSPLILRPTRRGRLDLGLRLYQREWVGLLRGDCNRLRADKCASTGP